MIKNSVFEYVRVYVYVCVFVKPGEAGIGRQGEMAGGGEKKTLGASDRER